MSETLDAAARLADGVPGVGDVAQYVLACQSLGYRHPDLTAHPGQIHDWYAAENGLDLAALEADCAALQAAATAAEDALARQEAQLAALTDAWQGLGANASREFLRRHDEAATIAAEAVRTAASALTDLRERLWRAVDEKVAKVLAIGDGVQARRADWLAAANTVTTGAGDRAVASELVDHEVKPFVDTVIGGEWLSAMREAADAINAAYEAATTELASESEAAFDIPGELGPAWTPSSAAGAPASPAAGPPAIPTSGVAVNPAVPASVIPAGWGGSAAPPPLAPPAVPVAAPPPPAPSLPTEPPVPQPAAAASLPSLGGGMPDFGGGLTSFGQQLGDMLGGLLGDGALDAAIDDGEPNVLPEPDLDERADSETAEAEEASEATDAGEAITDEAAGPDEATDPAIAEPMCQPEPHAAATVPPEPPGVPAEPPAVSPEPLAVSPEPPDAGTPCEIAADELPQVGE
ncbi:hypothetical protein H7I77_07885 [Mycolicibacterium novocastrense]|uniref:Uncharacterized protein n=1 Tax=Mycolicibacterium novocastrense TaxID=59813 RepID=A0AAW5SHL2_MYCNV|nr:hypothetical protein [Mycolicibacterium novocastrense]MCV7023269.1 hypothetical protein [Mycolicibacterium novocastrense]GAT12518.1 uncharacterized protein RMCN_5651 [Mycolicibacterium novocastrense]